MTNNLIPLRLVPVEVFGTVCEDHEEPRDVSFGLCDAVSSWSDCNRAEGKIYRIDDVPEKYRQPGETVTIYIRPEDRAFFEKVWRG